MAVRKYSQTDRGTRDSPRVATQLCVPTFAELYSKSVEPTRRSASTLTGEPGSPRILRVFIIKGSAFPLSPSYTQIMSVEPTTVVVRKYSDWGTRVATQFCVPTFAELYSNHYVY